MLPSRRRAFEGIGAGPDRTTPAFAQPIEALLSSSTLEAPLSLLSPRLGVPPSIGLMPSPALTFVLPLRLPRRLPSSSLFLPSFRLYLSIQSGTTCRFQSRETSGTSSSEGLPSPAVGDENMLLALMED
jgi:hypothetical protein